MFKAVGIAAKRTDTGIAVVVSIQTDAGREIARQTVTGADVPAVRALIVADLERRAAAEQDAGLSAAIVGKVLAQV
jgi:hypothetical protein